MEHRITRSIILNTTLNEAWIFFSDPKNLSKISPTEMSFKVLSTNLPTEIYEGLEIDYSVKPLLGIKMHWRSLISEVEKEKCFVDEQIIGPYKKWRHTHNFEETENGVLMTDQVIYQLPYGKLGNRLGLNIINRKLKTIFDYRSKMITSIFPEK